MTVRRDVMEEEIIIAEMVISLSFEVKVLHLKLVFQITGILNSNLIEYSKRNTIFEDTPPTYLLGKIHTVPSVVFA